jgi:arabinofuranosyltransferase
MLDERWSKLVVLVVLPLAVLLFYGTAVNHFGYSPDDTYIYLQYARNFIQGHGLSFNAGEPSYGFTSPLWTCIVTIGGALGVDVYVAAKAIDLLFASLTIVVLYFLSAEIVRDAVVALLTTLAFSLNVWQLRWAGSGMETSLAGLLVVSSILFCLRNEYLLAAVLTGLLTLVRPEACLLFALIIGDLYINTEDRKHFAKMSLAMCGVFALVLIPWLAYAYHTFGTFIPNTLHAKASAGVHFSEILKELSNSINIIAVSDGLGVVVLVTSMIVILRQVSLHRMDDGHRMERLFLFRQSFVGLLWMAILPVVYCVLRVPVLSRYFLIMTPTIGVFAFAYLFIAVHKSRWSSYRYVVVLVFAGCLFIQSQVVYRLIVRPGVEAFAQSMDSSLIPMGEWLKANSAPGDVVMSWDIGAIGYFSDRKICDAAGLVSPEMTALSAGGHTYRQIIAQRLYKPYANVQYIVHRSEQPGEFKDDPGLVPVLTRPFYGIGLMKKDLVYYTLYKVVDDSLEQRSKAKSP